MKTSISPNSGIRYELPKQGLERNRFCTDIPCCLIFLIFIFLFAILSFFAFQEGDPKQLLHPTDSQGNLCGSGKFLNQPYVYFFDWTQCVKAFNIPVNILKGRPFVCPTTQVCVQQCPNKTSYYTFQSYSQYRICTDDVAITDTDNEKLVNEGKCAPYIIASKPVFGRCVPLQVESLTNIIIQATDDNGINETIYDSSGQPLNSTKLDQGVKYLVDLLNLKQVGAFLVEDLTSSWKHILVAFGLASALSFVWIVLMRWLAKPIVWLGILLFIFILGVITGLSFYEFDQLRKKNGNQIVAEFKFVADAYYYRNLPVTWLIIGIVCAILLLISILVFLALLKRLRIALAILKEASKAVGYNIFSLFWPFIPFVLQIGVFAYWAVVAIYLSTSGKPIYRIAYNETIGNTTNVTLGGICDPNKWNISNGSNGQCVFWEYGYDPQVDLDSILNGTGVHFKSFISFVNQNQWIPQVFAAFMLFWLTAFVIGFSQLVLAGVYARYYWDRERFGVPCSTLFASLFRAIVFHLGTIAFGSLIIAIVKLIRGVLEYFEEKVKDKTGTIARFLFCCCRCCLFCLERFLKFLNRNAYIITAIYGTSFFTSARRAFHLIVSNPLRLLVIDKVCDFLIFLGKLCVTAGIGILAYFFFTHRIVQAEKFVPELHYYLVPLLLVIIGTYIIATCFFSVYSMAVDTLFICAIQDIQLQESNKDHHLMMPKGLKKVFGVKDK
jgi:choline transporter-like protein 2/4/5